MILESTLHKKYVPVYNDMKQIELASFPFPPSLIVKDQLPHFPLSYNKDFFRGKARFNPVLLLCSCNFTATNPQRDVKLLCKHLSEFIFVRLKSHIKPLTQLILSTQLKYGPESLFQLSPGVICGAKPRSSWISVYISENMVWKKFSFHLRENRWGFGKAPSNRKGIEEIIKRNLLQIEQNTG